MEDARLFFFSDLQLFQFNLYNLSFGTPCVGESVSGFGVHPMEIAAIDLVLDGLAVGRSHFQGESCNGDDEVWAYMCVHRGGGARCKAPVVNAGAGIFRGNSCGSDRRRRLRTHQKLDVQHIIRTRAYVVDPVRVRVAGEGQHGKGTCLGNRWRAFLLVPYLLRDRGAREGNGGAVVRMSMVERALAWRQSQMNDDYGFILQHYVMKRLIFNG